MSSSNTYTTSDIGLAAFLMLRGRNLISASQGGRGYKITFDNSDGMCEKISIEYMNSDFIRYDMYSKNLRIMIKKS